MRVRATMATREPPELLAARGQDLVSGREAKSLRIRDRQMKSVKCPQRGRESAQPIAGDVIVAPLNWDACVHGRLKMAEELLADSPGVRLARGAAAHELHRHRDEQLVVRARRRAAAGGGDAERVPRAAEQDGGVVEEGLDGAPMRSARCDDAGRDQRRARPRGGGAASRRRGYFECAEEHVPVYHQVCDALRDVRRNPEWQFVREGPTWHGRRVASWEDLFA